MSDFVHIVPIQQIGGSKKSSSKKICMFETNIISVLDLYDVKKMSEDDFKKVVNKSPKDVKDTIKGITNLTIELKKLNKITEIIPLPLSDGGSYWGDYAGDYLTEKYGYDWNTNYMYFTIYLNHDGDCIETDRDIGVGYSTLDKKAKIQMLNLLDEYLPKRYKWRGSNTEKIFISFKKGDPNKLDITKLKDDDTYPMMDIRIDFLRNTNLFQDDSDSVLKIAEKIKHLAKVDFSDYEYGMTYMGIRLYSIDNYEKYEKKIRSYLKQLIKDKKVSKYSIRLIKNSDS